jgi:hypothetical protein
MRRALCTAALLFVTSAYGAQADDCGRADFLSRANGPENSIGARSADDYFKAANKSLDSCAARLLRARYIRYFFDAFRSPGTTITGPASEEVAAMQAAAQAGAAYRRAHPDLVEATYKSYGYTPVSLEGVWTKSFERSDFVPLNGYRNETWWLEFLPELDQRLVASNRSDDGLRIKIRGYLSSPGGYGHLNSYVRQLYVDELSLASSERPAK